MRCPPETHACPDPSTHAHTHTKPESGRTRRAPGRVSHGPRPHTSAAKSRRARGYLGFVAGAQLPSCRIWRLRFVPGRQPLWLQLPLGPRPLLLLDRRPGPRLLGVFAPRGCRGLQGLLLALPPGRLGLRPVLLGFGPRHEAPEAHGELVLGLRFRGGRWGRGCHPWCCFLLAGRRSRLRRLSASRWLLGPPGLFPGQHFANHLADHPHHFLPGQPRAVLGLSLGLSRRARPGALQPVHSPGRGCPAIAVQQGLWARRWLRALGGCRLLLRARVFWLRLQTHALALPEAESLPIVGTLVPLPTHQCTCSGHPQARISWFGDCTRGCGFGRAPGTPRCPALPRPACRTSPVRRGVLHPWTLPAEPHLVVPVAPGCTQEASCQRAAEQAPEPAMQRRGGGHGARPPGAHALQPLPPQSTRAKLSSSPRGTEHRCSPPSACVVPLRSRDWSRKGGLRGVNLAWRGHHSPGEDQDCSPPMLRLPEEMLPGARSLRLDCSAAAGPGNTAASCRERTLRLPTCTVREGGCRRAHRFLRAPSPPDPPRVPSGREERVPRGAGLLHLPSPAAAACAVPGQHRAGSGGAGLAPTSPAQPSPGCPSWRPVAAGPHFTGSSCSPHPDSPLCRVLSQPPKCSHLWGGAPTPGGRGPATRSLPRAAGISRRVVQAWGSPRQSPPSNPPPGSRTYSPFLSPGLSHGQRFVLVLNLKGQIEKERVSITGSTCMHMRVRGRGDAEWGPRLRCAGPVPHGQPQQGGGSMDTGTTGAQASGQGVRNSPLGHRDWQGHVPGERLHLSLGGPGAQGFAATGLGLAAVREEAKCICQDCKSRAPAPVAGGKVETGPSPPGHSPGQAGLEQPKPALSPQEGSGFRP